MPPTRSASRRLPGYRTGPLEQLTRELLFAKRRSHHLDIKRAERLHDELDDERTYPLEFVAFRVTGLRRELPDPVVLVGEAVRHDLRRLIEALSRQHPMPVADEPGATQPELAARLNVTVKTLSRWRKRGLRWRYVEPPPPRRRPRRRRPARPASCTPTRRWRTFCSGFRSGRRRRRRSAGCLAEQRQRLLDRARRLADERPELSLGTVAEHLARRTPGDRSGQTLRDLLHKHDAEHPAEAIFPDERPPLTDRERRVIFRGHRRGISALKLARRFRRSRRTIYRVLVEQRAADAVAKRIAYHRSPTFDREDAEQVLLAKPLPVLRTAEVEAAGLPPVVVEAAAVRPLGEEAARRLLVRLHYHRHQAAVTQQRIAQGPARVVDVDLFDEQVEAAETARRLVVRSSLPLVLSLARRDVASRRRRGTALLPLLVAGAAVVWDLTLSHDPTRPPAFASLVSNRVLQRYAVAIDPLQPEDALVKHLLALVGDFQNTL